MLKTPVFINDPFLSMLAISSGRDARVKILEEGVVEIGHLSLDIIVWGRNAPEMYMGYPDIPKLHCFGVCDTPKQFLTKYRKIFKSDKRTFVVSFTHVAKNPDNAGKGGGWRWHKWGPYVGTKKHHYEYLDDEDGFEKGVYCYCIIQTDGPALKVDLKTGKLKPMKEI